MRRPLRLACLLPLGAPLLLAGCDLGVAGDEGEVRSVAAAYSDALARGDHAAACRLLAPDAARALVTQEQTSSCAEAIGKAGLESRAPRAVEVWQTAARAELVGGTALFLDRQPAGWRITAAGCRPRGENQPDDCDLEAS